MIGKIFVFLAFASAISAVLGYLFSVGKRENLIKTARYSYYALLVMILIISIIHLSNILAHNFQVTYVWQYSSRELSDFLLASTFYAGQEGSFLLWSLMVALIGYFLIPYARKHNYEWAVMGIYSLILTFLTIILIFKSPFEYIWETFPDEGLTPSFMPENGRGLNPILQNYWMAIHPPILFIGYSAMTVPYAFALAGLIKRDYKNWINVSLPWTIFATGILGFGIMLGGFWAYETLGWGGFWGWDPVENSSLLPWIIAVTLVHTMLVQRRTGGLIKTNLILSIMSFVLVLYATFLTRSGVLGDTSVHSFADPGKFIYALLVIFQITFFTLGISAIILRLKDISRQKLEFNPSSREFILSLGSVMLLVSAAVIFLGTSWPLITEILGVTKSSVEIEFYNTWNLPLIIGILLLNGASIYLSWKSTDLKNLKRNIITALIVSAIPTIIIIAFGVTQIGLIILAYSSIFALYINSKKIIKIIRQKPRSIGAYLSHAGLAIMMLGVLASGPMSQTDHLSLKLGEKQTTLGHHFTFIGKEQIEKQYPDREKYQYLIEVERNGSKTILTPIVNWSDFNAREAPFLEPSIKTIFTGDLYVAPLNVETRLEIPYVIVQKGETAIFEDFDNAKLSFVKFDMSQIMQEQTTHIAKLGAVIELQLSDTAYTDTLYTSLDMHTGNSDAIWKTIPNSNFEIGFLYFIQNRENMPLSKAVIAIKEINASLPEPTEAINLEITFKPFIWLVWVGVIFIFAGMMISITKYQKKNQPEPVKSISKAEEVKIAG